jgi:hypothetical protein
MLFSSLNSEALETFQNIQPGDCISFAGVAAKVSSALSGLLTIGVSVLLHLKIHDINQTVMVWLICGHIRLSV